MLQSLAITKYSLLKFVSLILFLYNFNTPVDLFAHFHIRLD